jgi:glucokinase
VENDANAAAVGAWMLDGAKRYSDMVCVTMGTGVGSGILSGGKLLRGATGSAGEIGHMTYNPDGVKCSCGNSGCFERYLGRDAIVARFLEISRRRKTVEAKSVTPRTVSMLASEGDRAALETWRRTGAILGVLLADVVDALNPSAVIIAGAVSRAHKFFLPSAVAEMKKRAFKHPARIVRVMVSGHDEILGVAGAALIASRPSRK